MKRIIATLAMLCVCISMSSIVSALANEDNADLKIFTISNGEIFSETSPSSTFHFIINYDNSLEMTIAIEPENPNSTIIFGQVTDNSGQFYENPLQEWEHTFEIDWSAEGIRLLVKVISENGENEKIYSFVVKSSQASDFSLISLGGDTTFMNIDNHNMRIHGSYIIPDENIINAAQGLVGDDDFVQYAYASPRDKTTILEIEYDKSSVLETLCILVKPNASGDGGASSMWGKNYRMYHIDNGATEQIPVRLESNKNVSFTTNKFGAFAIVYDSKAHTASFYDDWGGEYNEHGEYEYYKNVFYSIDNLAPNDLVPAPPTNPIKHGYTFLGWYTVNHTGQGKPWTLETTARERLDFYAYWEENPSRSSSSSPASSTTINTPTASTKSGTVKKGSLITLTSDYPSGGKIYYTTNGATPTINSSIYTDPILINEDTTIKYMVVVNGFSSNVVTEKYIVENNKQVGFKDNSNTTKYIKGYNDNTFKPDQSITRYEVIEALANLIDLPTSQSTSKFSDLTDNQNMLVNPFYENEIIQGYDDSTFKGDKGLTRAEFVTLLSNIIKPIKNNDISPFADIKKHWAESVIHQFYSLKYIDGYEDGTFKPDKEMTRAEFVAVMNRIILTKQSQTENIYTDLNSEHWAFDYIISACIVN